MTYSLDEIQEMLDALPNPKFRFDKVREDDLTYVGALRTIQGQNVVEPSKESGSMVIGLKPSIDFLTVAPEIVQQLVDTLRANSDGVTAEKPDEEDKSSLKTPISA